MEANQKSELEHLQITSFDAGEVFSGNPSGTIVKGYRTPCAYTPTHNPDFIFHESVRDLIVWFCASNEPLYIFGPPSVGKTSGIKQIAVRLNYPVFEITGHGRLEFADMVGHLAVHQGTMAFEYGPLALAMRYGGLLLLNEIDLTPPEVLAGLNTVLDGSPLCISENGGELIQPHPMFRFVATANTNGGGDLTGMYQGTQRQNLAWLDRFMLVEMGYPTPEVEKRLLEQKFPSLPKELCDHMISYANDVRKLYIGDASTDNFSDTLEVTFSTRSLLRWADLTLRYQPLARQGIQPIIYALDRALAFRASPESRATLHELAQRYFPRQEKTFAMQTPNASNMLLVGEEAIGYLTKSVSNTTTSYPYVHLEKHNYKADGTGAKFWEAKVQKDGLMLNYGAIGQSGINKHYPTDTCTDCDPRKEMIYRASAKIRTGYQLNLDKSHL